MSFVTGTCLLSTRGEVAVEDLAVGDELQTVSGTARPIAWIGSRVLAEPARADWPIRVRAGAFAEALPARDLLLSPGHLVVVKVMDEVFIPVGEIVNGATIAREPPAEVTYWQVELESHDVILSEGLKTASGLGARDWFAGGEGSPDPEPTPEIVSGYARPLVAGGPVIAAVRQRLIARAEALGWTRGEDMDLHLLIDDQRCEADIDGDLARFLFPASAESAVIASRVFVPAWRIGDYDERELGVSISGLNISDGLRVDRDIALDDAVLGEGFHGPEGSGERMWRWTRGGGVLPKALWEGCRGQVILRLGFDPHGGWSWQAPRGGETDVPADSKPVTLRVVSQRRKR